MDATNGFDMKFSWDPCVCCCVPCKVLRKFIVVKGVASVVAFQVFPVEVEECREHGMLMVLFESVSEMLVGVVWIKGDVLSVWHVDVQTDDGVGIVMKGIFENTPICFGGRETTTIDVL